MTDPMDETSLTRLENDIAHGIPSEAPTGGFSRVMSPEAHPYQVRMEAIYKQYPGIMANRGVDLRVPPGAFHAVVGENGAGKSTLLNILYGRTRPDAGRIDLRGEEVTRLLRSPADAIRRGVALVSQHYALIPALSVLENIMLGAEKATSGGILRPRQAAERAASLANRMGIHDLNLNLRADRLSVAAQQKVEILKALYRGASLLLLDEPTAALAPREAEALFSLLHTLIGEGATLIFVTHKLREVMAHSTNVTVLRAGRNAGDFVTASTTPQELLQQMIGSRPVTSAADSSSSPLHVEPEESRHPGSQSSAAPAAPALPPEPSSDPLLPRLRIERLTVRSVRGAAAVREVNLDVAAGEILGVAGIDGSGQRELAEAIVGLRDTEAGTIRVDDVEVQRWSVRRREAGGIAYIPEDRHRAGMILDFTVMENYLLGHEQQTEWGGGPLLRTKIVLERTEAMLKRYRVRVGDRGAIAAARTLSGGNQQKVVVARALDGRPKLLVACQPTRGLDVGAAEFVYEALRSARAMGLGVLLFSFDLDEVLEMSDRVAVMYNGEIVGQLSRAAATPESVGELMTGMTYSTKRAANTDAASVSDPRDSGGSR